MNRDKEEKSTTLNCFSPPVMIATFLIEIGLALYTAWRYRWNLLTKLAIITLLLLSTFQMAEFNICGGALSALDWSRIGFMAISVLPPLGLHLVATLSGHNHRKLLLFDYALAAIFVIFFGLFPSAVFHELCGGNYIIFHLDHTVGWLYGLYYYVSLFAAIGLAVWEYHRPRTSDLTKQSMRWVIVGMLVFMVPTAVVNTLDPSTFKGIPSILCGFAIFYALILALTILPANAKRRA